MISLQELKIFADLAQEKSFVKTAQLNFLTQPSISTHLKHLEEFLGVRLFERAPKKVRLTEEGEFLLPYVQDLLIKSANLETLASHSKKLPKGKVHITTIYSIGIYELAPILKNFMRTWPDIHVHLQYRRSDTIYDLIEKNQTDIGLVAYPESHPKIDITTFATDQMALIVPPQHPLAKKRSILLKDIENENFVAFDQGMPTRTAIDALFKRKNIHVSIRTTNDNIDAVKKAVEVGLGIAIVPCKTIQEEVKQKKLVRVLFRDVKLERPLGILTLRDRIPSHPMRLFINALTSQRIKKSAR